MIYCLQFCFNFALSFNLRRYVKVKGDGTGGWELWEQNGTGDLEPGELENWTLVSSSNGE